MTYNTKNSFGLASLAGGDAGSYFRSTLPLIKCAPLYPSCSSGLDYSCSNRENLQHGCTTCFAFPGESQSEHYVDLLQFSNFGGLPTPLLPGVKPPSRWLADLRYSVATPLPHSYPSVGQDVLNSQRVCAAIDRQIEAGCTLSVHQLKRKARHFFIAMKASLSRFVCKICGYILFKVFRRLMSKLLVSPEQVKRLQEASASGLPLVYLPLHKSHLDYLMITWTAWHFRLPLPHIASGDNLNLSGLGWLLRATGAFFIRRKTDPNDTSGKDAIYRAVLHSYIEQLMSRGMSIEFFLEGTRSRFGKSLIPKHGLISNIVEAYQQGQIRDCYLIPVSYTYEDVAEGIFLDELMGVPKVPESVFGAIRGLFKGFRLPGRCGAVRMHFGEPVLLSHYVDSLSSNLSARHATTSLTRIHHSTSYRELVPWHHEHEEKVDNRTLIRAIGYHLVHEAQAIVSISLPSVISALLLCKFTAGVVDKVLAADVEWLCNQIIVEGGDVMGWNDSQTHGRFALEHSLKYLRSSVDVNGSFVVPQRGHRHLMRLAYHKNALVPVFAVRSAIALALVSQNRDSVFVRDLIEEAAEICDWLQFEVIFTKPCMKIRDTIRQQLDRMCSLGGPLMVRQSDEIEEDLNTTNLCSDLTEILVRDSGSNHILTFYSNLLRPFLQSLFMTTDKFSNSLSGERESLLIRSMCREFLAAAKKQPFEVQLEAINSDSFKNAMQLLRSKKIITADPTDVRVLEPDQLSMLRTAILTRLSVFQIV